MFFVCIEQMTAIMKALFYFITQITTRSFSYNEIPLLNNMRILRKSMYIVGNSWQEMYGDNNILIYS